MLLENHPFAKNELSGIKAYTLGCISPKINNASSKVKKNHIGTED